MPFKIRSIQLLNNFEVFGPPAVLKIRISIERIKKNQAHHLLFIKTTKSGRFVSFLDQTDREDPYQFFIKPDLSDSPHPGQSGHKNKHDVPYSDEQCQGSLFILIKLT